MEKHIWTHTPPLCLRLLTIKHLRVASDLSISGGAYYGSSPIQTGARVDVVGLGSLSINPASSLSQKISQNRERNYSLTK